MPDDEKPVAPTEPAPRSVRATAPAPVAPPEAPATLTHEEWRAAKGTPLEQYAPAAAYHAWPVGFVLSEADFDAAIARAMGARLGSHPITLKHTS